MAKSKLIVAAITISDVFKAYDATDSTVAKQTDIFRAYVGFPSTEPAVMEARYQSLLAECVGTHEKHYSRTTSLMGECRWNCDKPYGVSRKKGAAIEPHSAEKIAEHAAKKLPGVRTAGTAKVVEVTQPLSDDAILIRTGVLGNLFLVESDRAILSRLITAITNSMHLATSSKK